MENISDKLPEKVNPNRQDTNHQDRMSETIPVETINPFDCQDQDVDSLVKIKTKDQKIILIDYMMLMFISDGFENIIENREEQKFIDGSEFSSENIIKTISFHLPRFNGKLNGA